jgi:predicted HAD superfamily hydrolase
MMGIHYVNHYANMAIQTLSKLRNVRKIEDMLSNLYAYFSHSSKNFFKFVELVDNLEIWVSVSQNPLTTLKSINIHFGKHVGFFCYFHLKECCLTQYCALVLNMHKLSIICSYFVT